MTSSNTQIEEQEVDYSVEDTQSQICCDRYPPMFTVTVNGEGARNTYTTAINCRGTRETLQFGITLRSPLRKHRSSFMQSHTSEAQN